MQSQSCVCEGMFSPNFYAWVVPFPLRAIFMTPKGFFLWTLPKFCFLN
jgi:hypothetical protein